MIAPSKARRQAGVGVAQSMIPRPPRVGGEGILARVAATRLNKARGAKDDCDDFLIGITVGRGGALTLLSYTQRINLDDKRSPQWRT
jgi:hypothetical protein